MASYSATRLHLSGSTDGRPIQVVGTTSGAADTAHTATATSGDVDEVHLWVVNRSGSAVIVTVWLGGLTTADEVAISVPANSDAVLLERANISGGLVVSVSAGTTNVCSVYGYVNRIEVDA